MSVWFTIPLGVGMIAVIIGVITRRKSGVTMLHIKY